MLLYVTICYKKQKIAPVGAGAIQGGCHDTITIHVYLKQPSLHGYCIISAPKCQI